VGLRNSSDESVLEERSGVLVPSDLDERGRSEGGVSSDGDAELFGEVDEGSTKMKARRVESARDRGDEEGDMRELKQKTYC